MFSKDFPFSKAPSTHVQSKICFPYATHSYLSFFLCASLFPISLRKSGKVID